VIEAFWKKPEIRLFEVLQIFRPAKKDTLKDGGLTWAVVEKTLKIPAQVSVKFQGYWNTPVDNPNLVLDSSAWWRRTYADGGPDDVLLCQYALCALSTPATTRKIETVWAELKGKENEQATQIEAETTIRRLKLYSNRDLLPKYEKPMTKRQREARNNPVDVDATPARPPAPVNVDDDAAARDGDAAARDDAAPGHDVDHDVDAAADDAVEVADADDLVF